MSDERRSGSGPKSKGKSAMNNHSNRKAARRRALPIPIQGHRLVEFSAWFRVVLPFLLLTVCRTSPRKGSLFRQPLAAILAYGQLHAGLTCCALRCLACDS
jgi:hypothetical protein